jgi:4-hydroxybenzoate polyprenyltransferase
MRSATSLTSSLRRLWQPHKPLFWLVVVFNVLSSAMAWGLHLARPEGVVLLLLTLLALANTGMGWWLLWRLWGETEDPRRVDQQGHGPEI